MITLIYTVKLDAVDAEKEWLNDMKVYPSIQLAFDTSINQWVRRFGMIVSPDTATVIKLRHPLQLQKEYRQR